MKVINNFANNKRGQIWVETVIYILIAFVMIGLVLSFVRPKVEELRDKAVIEQSIEIMNKLDEVFAEITIPGNKRVIEIGVKKGQMNFNSENDTISFEIESKFIYSEPGEIVYVGDLDVMTIEKGKYNFVTLKRNYSSQYNMTYQNLEISKTLTKASVPYNLVITNEGKDDSDKTIVNLDVA